MEDFEIKRLYYTRSEVSHLMHIPPHVLRAWENRFSKLKPMKSQSGRILFRPSDLALVKQIQSWKEEGYTDDKIQRLILDDDSGDGEHEANRWKVFSPRKAMFSHMTEELRAIIQILDE